MAPTEALLLTIGKDDIMRIGLPPKSIQDSYIDRAAVLGRLDNVSHVLCSPEGEMFCVRDRDLYRGPIPSTKVVDWFSMARRVGRNDWSELEILFFHPNGELYGTTKEGDLYKGPQPDRENVSWLYGQATKIGVSGWDICEALFFDPDGIMYAVTKKDKLVKGKPPTNPGCDWLNQSTLVGEGGWLKLSYYMSFTSDGKLWCVDKDNGDIYRGSIPDSGRYIDNAERLGWDYNIFHFLSFAHDKTIIDIISFKFLPEQGKRVSESPVAIEQRVYDNRNNGTPIKQTFKFDKVMKVSSSFTHDHGFPVKRGAEIRFIAGIPFISDNETSIKINSSTTDNWSFTETNETEVTFSSSSEVEVPPGKAIQVIASVVKADLIVPYRAKVKTLYGSETEVEGVWNGASLYNLTVIHKDYN